MGFIKRFIFLLLSRTFVKLIVSVVDVLYLETEMKLEYLNNLPSLTMKILDSTLGR